MKTDIIIQARCNSTRLPGKVLADFLGRPMLAFQIERLKRARNADEIVLATSIAPADDAVAEVGRTLGVRVVRGDEADVLGRYLQAANESGADIIVRVTADNPLTDPALVDAMIETFRAGGMDHLSSFDDHTYPYGVGCTVFTRQALESVSATTDPNDREHVEPALFRSDTIRTARMQAPDSLNRPEIWVTVDHPFELEKARRLAADLVAAKGMGFDTADIIAALDDVRILAIANGRVGYECVRHMRERGEKLVGLIVSPPQQSAMRTEIVEMSGLPAEDVLSPGNLADPGTVAWIARRRPDIIVCFGTPCIDAGAILDIPPRGVVNLRDARQPAGVMLHYVVRAPDEKPIIGQRKVPVHGSDMGPNRSLRLEQAQIELFKNCWNAVRVGPVRATPKAAAAT